MLGDHLNPDADAKDVILSMAGPISMEGAVDNGGVRMVHLVMEGERTRQDVLELRREADEVGAATLLRPGAYEQRLDVLLTVRAEVQDRRRLVSRSGTLEVEDAEGGLQGRFFFEVQPRYKGAEENWFALPGRSKQH